ncbi:MAG: ATP-dependent helicase RecQ [Desulfovibrionales bacterium]|nr:ATP-dependent helicase RecQ [Desulfovibrionales bacterium]
MAAPHNADTPTTDALTDALRSIFGFSGFIGMQRGVIEHVLAGGDAVVLMPTGGGKSLTYQLPAVMLPGLAVVVSPLIALMQDQVAGLTQAGVRAASLNSSLSAEASSSVVRRLLAGELDLLYVAPERLLAEGFLDLLSRTKLSLFAIDEAHCVSQWGHDFRPEYTRLDVLAERFPGLPRMALTATADDPTRKDIIEQLQLRDAKIFAAGFDRPNILYRILPKDQPRRQLLRFIQSEHPGDAGIVYRTTRKDVEETARWLQSQGLTALPYHAGLEPGVRRDNMERFMREDGVIICATVAFGMGVDKPDVRFVAHLDPPKSLEAYHQETGRAGRDGLPADAFMTYGLADVVRLGRLIESGGAEDAVKRVERRKLESLLGFCETPACRRQVLLGYFGETFDAPCGACDNCLNPPEVWDGTIAAQKALSCVYRTGQRFGAGHLTDVLLGTATPRVIQLGHDKLKTFGCGVEMGRRRWGSVYRQLAAAGMLAADPDGFGSLRLNKASWEVLEGHRSVTLRKDPPTAAARSGKRSASVDEAGILQAEEAMILWEALRKLRRRMAEEQETPPYAIFPDRSLLEMVRSRPRNEAEFSLVHGVGKAKLAQYAKPFLETLLNHEYEHGRPEYVEDFPEEAAARRSKPAVKSASLSPTACESLELFEELGDADAVAGRRGLKTATVLTHLTQAVAAGRIDAERACGLDSDSFHRVRDALQAFEARGITALSPVFESLGRIYDFEILRMVRSGLRR